MTRTNLWRRFDLLKKVLVTSLALLLALLAAAGGGGYWYVHRSLAVTAGELLVGVEKAVRIDRDAYGVPHIQAETEHDAYFAQGYVHAQDRLLQIELTRRAINGGLSALMGESTLVSDRFYLTIGFQRAAEEAVPKLPDDTRRALQAYADGINNFIADAKTTGKLPAEFKALGIDPAPWQIADTLAIGKVMAWDLGGNMRTELFLSQLVPQVGPEKALSLVPFALNVKPSDLVDQHPVAAQSDSQTGDLLHLIAQARDMGTPGEGIGSNNWVVSGAKSASGKPLLASDMHLMLGAPSIFYQNSLVVPGVMNVSGAIFPGVPGVIVGHTDRTSWAFTNGMTDVQDLYIEKPHPQNPHQFAYNGTYETAKVYPQEIAVKGKEPVKFDVLVTRHGPIITDLLEPLEDTGVLSTPIQQRVANKVTEPLALRWVAHDFSDEIGAMLRFNKAKDWTAFEAALREFYAPVQNVIYADVDGNIAWRHNGHIPIRKKGTGLLPVPGWTDEYEWTGYIPWEELPQTVNPPDGVIATANNRVIDASYPYVLSHEWEPNYRVDRINELLNEKPKLTVDDFTKMQTDWKNRQALQNLPVWLKILEAGEWSPLETEALQALRDWSPNPTDNPDLIGPSIYHNTYLKIVEATYKPLLGDKLYYQFMRTGLPFNAVDALFQQNQPIWFQSTEQTTAQVVRDGFRTAVADLAAKHGDNAEKWKWGTLHQLTLSHPLGGIKPLHLLFNDGPYPTGGSNHTVGMGGFPKTKPFQMVLGAPWRFAVDMGDPSAARDIMILGASAQLGSPHYKDQTQLWITGQTKPLHSETVETLLLQPASSL